VINRLVYGAGTNLITSAGDPALDGVYKLVAVQQADRWIPAIKISESPAKTLNPGHKLVWRIYDRRGKATADLLSLDDEDPREMTDIVLHHPSDHTRYRTLHRDDVQEIEPLLIDVLQDGHLVYELPSIEAMRAYRKADMNRLDAGVRRLLNPHIYHVSLTQRLWELKQRLIESASA
jgi:nicotinate phosphoribosyltransferase